MKKRLYVLMTALAFCTLGAEAQTTGTDELAVGLRFQKTEKLYWENGIGLDYTSSLLLDKRVHLKMSFATSRLGSALGSNALRQENYLIGADWRFRPEKPLQLFAGLNTGLFHADMETEAFEVLPHNSLLLSAEAGLFYRFKFPAAANLSIGYNLLNGDGVSRPGTLFPVFYQLSLYYYLWK